jgi:hypothetical protein
VNAIPVTGLDRDEEYNTSIAQIINKDQRGVAVRLLQEDIEDTVSTRVIIGELLRLLNVREQEVHLVGCANPKLISKRG